MTDHAEYLKRWLDLARQLEHDAPIQSACLHKDSTQTIDALLMTEGAEIAPHDCPYPVRVSVAEGDVRITIATTAHTLGAGEQLSIPGHTMRGLCAMSDTKMIIQLLKQ